MPSDSNKKLLILYVLKILEEYSDENHPLKYNDIISKIYSSYGMTVERKSIGANIQTLIDFGYDIQNIARKGWYLAERPLEESEITFLIDAVFCSNSISGNYSVELANKLSAFLSKHKRKKYKYIYKAKEIQRSDNKQLFFTIDVLNDAIAQKKKVSFNYIRYDENKNAINSKDGYRYVVNPYFMINNGGKYYLVCNYDKYDGLAHYKIDRIANIELLQEDIKPLKSLNGYENGIDIAEYVNNHIYMFGNDTIKAKFKLTKAGIIDKLVEEFGDKIHIENVYGEYYATIKATEESLIVWSLHYGDCVELVTPIETRAKLQQIVQDMNKKYNG